MKWTSGQRRTCHTKKIATLTPTIILLVICSILTVSAFTPNRKKKPAKVPDSLLQQPYNIRHHHHHQISTTTMTTPVTSSSSASSAHQNVNLGRGIFLSPLVNDTSTNSTEPLSSSKTVHRPTVHHHHKKPKNVKKPGHKSSHHHGLKNSFDKKPNHRRHRPHRDQLKEFRSLKKPQNSSSTSTANFGERKTSRKRHHSVVLQRGGPKIVNKITKISPPVNQTMTKVTSNTINVTTQPILAHETNFTKIPGSQSQVNSSHLDHDQNFENNMKNGAAGRAVVGFFDNFDGDDDDPEKMMAPAEEEWPERGGGGKNRKGMTTLSSKFRGRGRQQFMDEYEDGGTKDSHKKAERREWGDECVPTNDPDDDECHIYTKDFSNAKLLRCDDNDKICVCRPAIDDGPPSEYSKELGICLVPAYFSCNQTAECAPFLVCAKPRPRDYEIDPEINPGVKKICRPYVNMTRSLSASRVLNKKVLVMTMISSFFVSGFDMMSIWSFAMWFPFLGGLIHNKIQ